MSRRYGIGIVVTNLPGDEPGGAQLQAVRMARELAADHRVTIFSRGRRGSAAGLDLAGVDIVLREPPPIPGVRLVADLRAAVGQIRARRGDIDVLVCYQTLASGAIGAVARRWGIPYFVFIRGRREYQTAPFSPYRFLTPLILGIADRVLVQTPGIANELLQTYDAPATRALHRRLVSRVRVVPNGVEERPRRVATGSYVVYVGRLVPIKGVDVLLRAMRSLPGVELRIVGDGPERRSLEAMAAGMNVSFLGRLSHEQALKAIEGAMCLVLPSRSEASSNVVLEALSMGVPVVATRVGGTPELVPENGFLVPPDDPRALADAIARIARSEEERIAMGHRAHARAAAFRWTAAARRLVDEIEAVIGP